MATVKERVEKLIYHLLRQKYDIFSPTRTQAVRYIAVHRLALHDAVQHSRRVWKTLPWTMHEVYPKARDRAAKACARRWEAFPESCPFTADELLWPDFLPAPEELPFAPYQVESGDDLVRDYAEAGFFLTQMTQDTTGLPVMAWAMTWPVSKRWCTVVMGSTRKRWPAARLCEGKLFYVGKRPRPLEGSPYPRSYESPAKTFIEKNRTPLRAHWRGDIDSGELLASLRKVGV